MRNNSSNFDGTAPLERSLLKAIIESAAFVNGWNSKDVREDANYTMQTRESPNRNYKSDSLCEADERYNIFDRLAPNSVYCSHNLLALELMGKQYRFWITSKGNAETHKGENREQEVDEEVKSLHTLCNCVKRQILKTEPCTQSDEISSGKESSLTRRKEVKDQSTQTIDD
ncbi:unnamed protein product [Mytilus coruscus]|uniref:Uncharacterized protein n=1 Tax=Mytilus coruscus TaxID=42192 RepID=A0A6J8A4V8_MYTCO|nr:unnamed protein product [Mytilus coruscus]